MSDVNEVRLVGSLARDVDMRYTGSGKAVSNFSLLTKSGKFSEFHSCVAWEDHAKAIQSLRKGAVVGINGRLQTRSWDQAGTKRYKTEVVVNSLVIDGAQESAPEDYDTSAPVTEDDLPF